MLVKPAIERRRADRESAGEIGIVRAEAAEDLRLAGELGAVVCGAGHGGNVWD